MASVKRAAEAIMAALSVQSASGAAVASGRAARSSEFAATPPTTAILRGAGLARGLPRSLYERAHDRALVARGQIGAPSFQLLRRQFLDA